MGGGPRGSQGDDLYTAANQPVGAVFTYYLQSPLRTLRQRRQQAERSAAQKNQDVLYPLSSKMRPMVALSRSMMLLYPGKPVDCSEMTPNPAE